MPGDHTFYRFGPFALDPVAKVLFRDGEPVHMTRKTVETLLALVEHAGQVVTKEEMMRAVWRDRVVDEANLAQNIAVIRKTLGAQKGTPAYIETFPGRGYRLEGPVSTEVPAPPRRRPLLLPVLAGIGVIAAALAVIFLLRPRPERPPEFRVTPVSRLPGKEYQPAISPDGTKVAFLASESGGAPPALWMAVVGGAASEQLTAKAAHHTSPAWSPDGRSIAFLRYSPGGADVVILDVASKGERVVANLAPPNFGLDYRLLDWSPNGETLAVCHSEAAGAPTGVILLSARTGERTVLTRPGGDVLADVDPRFSPDGATLTFVRVIHRFHQEVFSVPVSGGSPKQVTRIAKRIPSHDWMRDGATLLVASDRTGEFRLWKLALRNPARLEQVAIYSEFPIQIAAARKAPALSYAALHQDRNIWRLDLAGGTWKRVIASSGQDASPVYSPDGTRICFRSDRSGDEQLWVAGADGARPVQITHGNVRPSVGRWSPDGKSIVFNSPQTGEVYVVDYDGAAWHMRSTGVRGVHPVYSADGKWIYAGGASIVRIPAAGGQPVTVRDGKAEALAVSPDGTRLYFARDPNDAGVWRLALDGGAAGPERVLDRVLPGCTSCWSVAADGVYYLGTRDNAFDRQALFFRAWKGGEDRLIAEYPEPLWPHGSGPFSLSPDGAHLLCVRVDPTASDAMLVSPFE